LVDPNERRSFEERAAQYWTKSRIEKLCATKKLALTPSNSSWLLRKLGLLNSDASMSHDAVRKFLQTNHLLNLIKPQLKQAAEKFPTIHILDLCCGKSYLSFLIAWYFTEIDVHDFRILAIDSNEKLIGKVRDLAEQLGLSKRFECLSSTVTPDDLNTQFLQSFALSEGRVHIALGLHACDTASDDVIAAAIRTKVDYLAIAPCCQAELAREWEARSEQTHPFSPMFKIPHFRREIAADMTDLLRFLLIKAHGYEASVTEFTSPEHTPKNRLITAIRRGNYLKSAQKEFEELKAHLNQSDTRLELLLKGSGTEQSSRES
jgi:hypothetical protein